MSMNYSKSGLALTEQFEGCRLTPYQDPVGVWTDGYGNTHHVIAGGPPITQLQAERDLLANVQTAVNCVNANVVVKLTQGEFDALVDFTFNLGCSALIHSTLLRLLNDGDYSAAADQLVLWDRAGGKVLAGLLHRRQAEEAEFNQATGDSTWTDDILHIGSLASSLPSSGSGATESVSQPPPLPLQQVLYPGSSDTPLPLSLPKVLPIPRPRETPPQPAQLQLKDDTMTTPTASQLFSDFAALVKADETKMIAPLLATAMANYLKAPTLVNFAAQAATFAESAMNNQAIVGSEVASSMMALVNQTLAQMAAADVAQLASTAAPTGPVPVPPTSV